jgi:hypothetical protein
MKILQFSNKIHIKISKHLNKIKRYKIQLILKLLHKFNYKINKIF